MNNHPILSPATAVKQHLTVGECYAPCTQKDRKAKIHKFSKEK